MQQEPCPTESPNSSPPPRVIDTFAGLAPPVSSNGNLANAISEQSHDTENETLVAEDAVQATRRPGGADEARSSMITTGPNRSETPQTPLRVGGQPSQQTAGPYSIYLYPAPPGGLAPNLTINNHYHYFSSPHQASNGHNIGKE
jgi:hypothetical protein